MPGIFTENGRTPIQTRIWQVVMKGEYKQKGLLWGDRLSRWSIGLVFLVAGVPKLFHLQEFAKVIDAYAILPEVLILPTAIILPVVEIFLAMGVLCNGWMSKIGSTALLLLFISLLSYAIWMGLDIDCGCFGPEDPEFTAFHGLRGALVRDIAMFLPLVYSFWYHRYRRTNFQFQGDS